MLLAEVWVGRLAKVKGRAFCHCGLADWYKVPHFFIHSTNTEIYIRS